MRERLAQIWDMDEGKNPFEKENKKEEKIPKKNHDRRTCHEGKRLIPKSMISNEEFIELTEVSKEDLPTIYCDMDQVLVNLLKGAEKVLGQPLDSFGPL